MREDFRHKIVIDPVHGDIGLSKLETELIDTPTFQRLRRIKQLGFAYMVYPNARHSRFEHSLGVMHLMSRILESFRSKNEKALSDDDFRKLRIAALLHDIGHYPYSHLMEKINWDSTQEYISRRGQDQKQEMPLPKKYPKHERLGEIVIKERKDISEKLKNNGIDPKDIAALVRGQHQTFPNLLSASLDVDRLDYLVRDALNTGLPYGNVDLNYIVNNLELTDDMEIVVREKAKSSIEHMLMGRYFMTNTVYMHKTVFAFEEMVRRIVLAFWKRGKIYKSGNEIENMVRGDSEEFLSFHDGYLNTRIEEHAKDIGDEHLATLCSAIVLRRPPKLVCEVSELTWNDNNPSEEYTLLRRGWRDKVRELAEDPSVAVPEDRWIFRDVPGPEFERVYPFMSLAEARELGQSNQPGLRELVKVRKRSDQITNLLEEKSSVLHYMSRLKPKLCRLYVVGIGNAKADLIRAKIQAWLKPQT